MQEEEGGEGRATPGRTLAWQTGLLVVLSAACTRDDTGYRGPRDAAIDGGSGGDAAADVPVRDGASGGTGGGTGGATGGSAVDARVDARDTGPDAPTDARPDGPDASPDAREGGVAGAGGGGRGGGGGAGKGGGGGRGGNGGSAGGGFGGGAGNTQGGSAGGDGGRGGTAGTTGGGGSTSAGGGGAGGSCTTMTAALAPTQVATFIYAPTRDILYGAVGTVKGNGAENVAWFSFAWPPSFTGATLSAAQLRIVFDSVAQSGDLIAYTSTTTAWPSQLQVMTDATATIDLTLAVSEKVTPASTPAPTVFPLSVAALQTSLNAGQPLSLGIDGAGSVNATAGPSVAASSTGVSLQLTACTP